MRRVIKLVTAGLMIINIMAINCYAGQWQERKEKEWAISPDRIEYETLYQDITSLEAGKNTNGTTDDFAMKQTAVDCVNALRTHNGLDEVVMDDTLMDAAQQRAEELATLFSETRPDGNDIISLIDGVNCSYVKENYGTSKTAVSMASKWYSSNVKDNILNVKNKRIGIGCYICNGKTYWAELITD